MNTDRIDKRRALGANSGVLAGRARHAHWCDWRETWSPAFRAGADVFFADRPCADGQPAP